MFLAAKLSHVLHFNLTKSGHLSSFTFKLFHNVHPLFSSIFDNNNINKKHSSVSMATLAKLELKAATPRATKTEGLTTATTEERLEYEVGIYICNREKHRFGKTRFPSARMCLFYVCLIDLTEFQQYLGHITTVSQSIKVIGFTRTSLFTPQTFKCFLTSQPN